MPTAPSETSTLVRALDAVGLAYVLALKPHTGLRAGTEVAYAPAEAARSGGWRDSEHPGAWVAVTRAFRDGHTETWWAADLPLGTWHPDGPVRMVVATTDPATLPDHTTWYLVTSRPLWVPRSRPSRSSGVDSATSWILTLSGSAVVRERLTVYYVSLYCPGG